jgi:hypothetical protein
MVRIRGSGYVGTRNLDEWMMIDVADERAMCCAAQARVAKNNDRTLIERSKSGVVEWHFFGTAFRNRSDLRVYCSLNPSAAYNFLVACGFC